MADNQTTTVNSDVEHHVKFKIEEDEFKNHHENLEIEKVADYEYKVNLGYLKIDHYYKMKFNIDLSSITNEQSKINYLVHKSSRHLSFKEIKQEENGSYSFSLIFHAYKEKVDIEKAYFSLADEQTNGNHHENGFSNGVHGHESQSSLNSNGSNHSHHIRDDSKEPRLLINFEAKVLGAHQGTPLLRNGIILLQHPNNYTNSEKSHLAHFNIN